MELVRGIFFAHCLFLLLSLSAEVSKASYIGVCYGRNADDLPTPDKVAQLVKAHSIKYVRIYDSNIQVLKAFANSGVEMMVGIPNADLLGFSQFQSNADSWLKNNILPYYPATKITYITVGAEVTEVSGNTSSLIVPAMQKIHTALLKVGLNKKIKVSTTHSLGVLSRSFPPSAGAFNSKFAFFLKPMLEFLAENQSPFMVDIYPYYAYRDSPSNVSLDYALFSSSSSSAVVDPNTGLVYTNMFDAQVDALYFALTALSFKTLKIMVTETGWPTKGSAKETAATPGNAQIYNSNLIRRVINDSGTPFKPGEEIDVYIFSLFNENRKPGLDSERNWGLFYPDQTSAYNLDLTGKESSSAVSGVNNTLSNGTWCISSSNASDVDIQSALDWACGRGNVDCSPIQPSQACYQPDTLASHASYAFNSYYQQNGASPVACSFGGTAMITNKNPRPRLCASNGLFDLTCCLSNLWTKHCYMPTSNWKEVIGKKCATSACCVCSPLDWLNEKEVIGKKCATSACSYGYDNCQYATQGNVLANTNSTGIASSASAEHSFGTRITAILILVLLEVLVSLSLSRL